MNSAILAYRNFFTLMALVILAGVLRVGEVQGEGGDQVTEGQLNGNATSGGTGNTTWSGNSDYVTSSSHTGQLPDKPHRMNLVRMPAYRMYRGNLNSNDYKKFLRNEITSVVPVMFQTMAMVENGAHQGYANALQAVAITLNNQMVAADLDVKLRGILDGGGTTQQRAFANAVFRGMDENKRSEFSSAVGLAAVARDSLIEPLEERHKYADPQLNNADPFQEYIDSGTGSGSQSYSGGGGQGAVLLASTGSDPKSYSGGGGQGEKLLSKIFFPEDSKDPAVSDARNFFTDYIGDLKYVADQTSASDPRAAQRWEIIKPKKQKQVARSSNSGSQPPAQIQVPDQIYGGAVALADVRKFKWREFMILLSISCDLKTQNGNAGVEIFQKKTLADFMSEQGKESIRRVSSPNFKMTYNTVDAFFKTFVQLSVEANQPTQIKCDVNPNSDTMPEDFDAVVGKGDNCKGEDAKKCRQNYLLYNLIDILALDQVNSAIRNSYEIAMMQSLMMGPELVSALNSLYCTSLNSTTATGNGGAQCNIAFNLDSIEGALRQRWGDIHEDLRAIASSLGSASNFRFYGNSAQSATSGGAPTGGGGGGGK